MAYRPSEFYSFNGEIDQYYSRQAQQLQEIQQRELKQQQAQQIRNLKPGSKEHMQYWAQFAQLSYENNRETRQQKAPEGWILDNELSNRNRAVYFNQDSGMVILAERGTKTSGKSALADLATDAGLAMGVTGAQSRFRNSLKTAKAIQQKYADYDLVVTGHSLGGSVVKYVAENLDLQGIVFSAHLPTREILSTAIGNTAMGRNENITAYTVPWDPVGAGMYISGSAHAVKQTESSPHALTNFTA